MNNEIENLERPNAERKDKEREKKLISQYLYAFLHLIFFSILLFFLFSLALGFHLWTSKSMWQVPDKSPNLYAIINKVGGEQ